MYKEIGKIVSVIIKSLPVDMKLQATYFLNGFSNKWISVLLIFFVLFNQEF